MGNSMNIVATTSDNSGHTATVLRTFAQIRQSRTSHVRKMFYLIGHEHIFVFKKPQDEKELKKYKFSIKWW